MFKVQYPSYYPSYRVPPPVFLFPRPLRRGLEMETAKRHRSATCILPSLVLFCPLLSLALIMPARVLT